MKLVKETLGCLLLIVLLIAPSMADASVVKGHELGAPLSVKLPTSKDIHVGYFTELECLALNIYHEARGETRLGKELVAQVTMNRVRIKGYPKTVCGVVRQDKQFAWTQDGKSDYPTNVEAYADAMLIAIKFLYSNHVVNFPDAERLTNFHSYKKTPTSWSGHVTYVGKEKGHRFYIQTKPIVYEDDVDIQTIKSRGIKVNADLRIGRT